MRIFTFEKVVKKIGIDFISSLCLLGLGLHELHGHHTGFDLNVRRHYFHNA
jgi:hypothetical protein